MPAIVLECVTVSSAQDNTFAPMVPVHVMFEFACIVPFTFKLPDTVREPAVEVLSGIPGFAGTGAVNVRVVP